jgi:hypothetical protein
MTEMHYQMGGYTQKILFTYNEHGDQSEMVLRTSGGGPADLEILHVYVYDQHGNWTAQTTSSPRLAEARMNLLGILPLIEDNLFTTESTDIASAPQPNTRSEC